MQVRAFETYIPLRNRKFNPTGIGNEGDRLVSAIIPHALMLMTIAP